MKKFTLQLLVLAAMTIWGAVATLPDNNLHVVFCDVGQGDATLISYKTYQILVDAGPDNRVLECLTRHMPFYDRTLEALVITHDQKDHNGGARYITERYSVVQFEPVLSRGDQLAVGTLKLDTLWPEKAVLGMNTLSKHNNEGMVNMITWNKFTLLLTADVSMNVISEDPSVVVMKVPHHGSKYAMDSGWLEKVKPKIAVISVGENRYGHPAPETLKVLSALGINVLRTDIDGEVEIVTDGENYQIKTMKNLSN